MEGENPPSRERRRAGPPCLASGRTSIIKLIYELRFARIDNLVALTGRAYKKIHGRVFKMVDRGYLKRIVPPLQKYIFAIGSAAVPVLLASRG